MLARIFLVLMYLGCLFDPSGKALGLKYVAFVGFIGCSAWMLVHRREQWPLGAHVLHAGFFIVVLPLIALGITYARSGSLWLDGDITFMTAGIYLIHTLLFGSRENLDFALSALDRCLRIFAIFAVSATAVELAGGHLPGILYLQTHGSLVVSSRSYGGCVLPYVYTVGSPLLIFGLSRAWFGFFAGKGRRELAWALVFSGAMLLSGTRGNMLMGVIGPFMMWLWVRRGMWEAVGGVAALIATLFVVIRFGLGAPPPDAASREPSLTGEAEISMVCMKHGVTTPFAGMLEPEEHSNAVKLGYLPAYKKLFSDSSTLFFGQGLNARSWSETTRAMLPKNSHITELIYLDLFRMVGLIWALLVLFLLGLPLLKWRVFAREHAYCPAAWAAYLLLSASNPYIFSSTGMTAFALILAALYQKRHAPEGSPAA